MPIKFSDKCLLFFFPILVVVQLLAVFGIDNPYFAYLFYFFILFYGARSFLKITYNLSQKMLMFGMILYFIISGFTSGMPMSFLSNELRFFIIPCFFLFAGMYYPYDDFYKRYLYVTIFCVVIGFILYVLRPSFYANYLANVYNNSWYTSGTISGSSAMMEMFRFSSIFGSSYAISYHVTFGLCILLNDFFRTKPLINSDFYRVVLICLFIGAITLSSHRVAMAYSALLLGVAYLYGKFTHNNIAKYIFYIVLVFITLIVLLSIFADKMYFDFIKSNVLDRLMEMDYETAMEQGRNAQTERALGGWNNVVFGDGTGSKGAFAREAGLPAITDGGYIKLLTENGILGCSIFALLIISTIFRTLKYIKIYRVELLIIVYVLFSMLGANSLSINYHYVLLFWFSIGRVWNKKILYINNPN